MGQRELVSNDMASVEDKDGLGISTPIRVMLVTPHTICTIWLPATMEGCYKFRDNDGKFAQLPFYIDARNNEWIAHVGRGAVLITDGDRGASEMPITDGSSLSVEYQHTVYSVFAEKVHRRDYVFIPYCFEKYGEYTIGRQENQSICYPNKSVSREHAKLWWQKNAWHIADCGSKNRTYVNGRAIRTSRLKCGDTVFIMGLYILIGSGFLALNNANGRVRITTNRIRQICEQSELIYSQQMTEVPRGDLFDRMPRKIRKIESEPIDIDMPPMAMTGNKIPLLLRLGSPIVMGGRALATGNILMTLTSLVFPALTQGLTEKDRKEYEAKRITVYRDYLTKKEIEIENEKKREERLLNEHYPCLSSALQFATDKARLWERQKHDEDFLSIRIGTGQRPLIAERKYAPKKLELEPDVLAEEMYALAEKPVLLDDVPIMLSLMGDYYVGVLGQPQEKIKLLQNMIQQFALTHSYDEVKIALLVDGENAAAFDFVRYLPHNWDNSRSIRFFVSSKSDALHFSEYLRGETEESLKTEENSKVLKSKPAYVVFVLSKILFDCVECFKELLLQDHYCGISIVAAFEGIPKECSKIIDLRESNSFVLTDLKSDGEEERVFAFDRYEQSDGLSSMREIMRTKLKINSQSFSLPSMITFLEMFGAGRVEHLNPIKRWNENNPVKSLAAPIGVGTDGELFTLDLHEKQQGPHGLVAGMTGSGKSEFLITYILSMAVNYSPDEVAFILIDYKGGGLADAFEDKTKDVHLPHLVGTITNLDGASIQRSLMSIKSELTRRQRVFKKVKEQTSEGTLDIYDYQKLYRNKKVADPMPHLFIISDEFAELKQQQPEFMDELISAARIGRSLGVHLILATQKPGGVVNNQIWSNTKFRACLRVQDRSDSMEMLKRPEAAELKQTGRFYLQVGYNEYFALGQSAWCGADYLPQDEPPVNVDDAVQFIDNVGQTVLSMRPEKHGEKAQMRQIVAVVRYLSELAKREHIATHKLWAEPLPKTLELSKLIETHKEAEQNKISALIGLIDDPEYQTQFPFQLQLSEFHNMMLVGSAGSGKSTLLRTMLFSLVCNYSPEKLTYYILDLSNNALSGYRHMPHCGAYLTEKDEADVDRLLDMLHNIIAQRKKRFAETGITSFDAFCQLYPTPMILFIVDGYTNIKNLKKGENYFLSFQDYLRDGANYGVRIILTCNHTNEISLQSKQEIDYRLALQAKDHYEHSDILGVRCKTEIPAVNGRGMCVVDGRPLEYHVAMLDADKPEEQRPALLKERLAQIEEKYAACKPAQKLPVVDVSQTYKAFCESFQPERIPLGYASKDMAPVAIPFQQLHSMSLYLGNPKGVRPVFNNLITAAAQNGMEVIALRRQGDSVFEDADQKNVLSEYPGKATLLECQAEGLVTLTQTITDEIAARNAYRDEYSIQQGIPLTTKGRAKRAARYIRAHSTPLFVIIESFMDFCKAVNDDQELIGKFTVFFSRMKFYNIYFAAGFYPDDDKATARHALMKCYNQEQFFLLFGGRFDKLVIPDIPYEVSKLSNLNPAYNQILMKYHDVFYSLTMPCGAINARPKDPDEEAII